MCSANACAATFSLVKIIMFKLGSKTSSPTTKMAADLVLPAPNTPLMGRSVRPSNSASTSARIAERTCSSGLHNRGCIAYHNASSASLCVLCPPTRLKASPAKEVIKHSGKARNEQVGTGETAKGGTSERKGKHGQPPLRRAGMDTTRKLNFFSKSNGTACQSRGPVVGEEKLEGDVYMIDVERLIAADELRKQAVAVEQIRDAGSKWLTQSPEAQRNEIERLAVSFLLAMNSTLCFFTVAMRMLSKAPWTDPMITPDVRQAAMVAISRGWFVKSENFTKYPFTRAELALAAGAYRGLLVPTIPDDTTVALRTIIDHLPHACATMFTQAEVACPFCQAKRKGIVPTFSCSTTWKQSGWANLKTALEQAQPFLGYIPKGWHREGCDRDDQCPTVTKLGKWLYLELRPRLATRIVCCRLCTVSTLPARRSSCEFLNVGLLHPAALSKIPVTCSILKTSCVKGCTP